MKRTDLIWGSAVSVDVRQQVDPGAIDDVFAWFATVDRLFSTWREDSEIARFARGELGPHDLDPEVVAVLELAERLRVETDGAFDVRATAALPEPHPAGWCPVDPSGVVKGWAVDRAVRILEGHGATDVCINAGGDVATRGSPSPGGTWKVGIRHPWQPGAVAAVVAVTNAAVATSGRYERGDHVVDPRTGLPAQGLASVTIVGDDLARADAYATSAMALGHAGLAWLADRCPYDALAITDDEVVWTTAGFARWRVDPDG